MTSDDETRLSSYEFHDQVMRVLPINKFSSAYGRDRVGIDFLRIKALKRTRVDIINSRWRLKIDCHSKVTPDSQLDLVGPELAANALNLLFAVLYQENKNLFAVDAHDSLASFHNDDWRQPK